MKKLILIFLFNQPYFYNIYDSTLEYKNNDDGYDIIYFNDVCFGKVQSTTNQ